jgi:hypothetical protein
MSLLFRPRCPPRHPVDDVASYRAVTRGHGLDAAGDGDVTADLEQMSHALAGERIGTDVAFSEVEFSADTEVVERAGWVEWVVTAVCVATGGRITIRGATVAEVDGDRITAARHYWDELARFDGSDGFALPPRD